MKKISFIVIGVSAILFIAGCKKEKDEIPAASGYWKGAIAAGQEMSLMQWGNGKGRLYFFSSNGSKDTAQAALKLDGNWQQNGNSYSGIYRVDSIDYTVTMKALLGEPSGSMTGPVYITGPTGTLASTFTILRQ